MRLTKDEITLIAGIFLILAIGASMKHFRSTHRAIPAPQAAKAEPEL